MLTTFVHFRDTAFTAALRQKLGDCTGSLFFFDPDVNHYSIDSHPFTIKRS